MSTSLCLATPKIVFIGYDLEKKKFYYCNCLTGVNFPSLTQTHNGSCTELTSLNLLQSSLWNILLHIMLILVCHCYLLLLLIFSNCHLSILRLNLFECTSVNFSKQSIRWYILASKYYSFCICFMVSSLCPHLQRTYIASLRHTSYNCCIFIIFAVYKMANKLKY